MLPARELPNPRWCQVQPQALDALLCFLVSFVCNSADVVLPCYRTIKLCMVSGTTPSTQCVTLLSCLDDLQQCECDVACWRTTKPRCHVQLQTFYASVSILFLDCLACACSYWYDVLQLIVPCEEMTFCCVDCCMVQHPQHSNESSCLQPA